MHRLSAILGLLLCAGCGGENEPEWTTLDLEGYRVDAIWAESATTAWVAGDNGAVLRCSARQCEPLPVPVYEYLSNVWSDGLGNVWVAANVSVEGSSNLFRWDGAVWSSYAVPTVVRALTGLGTHDLWSAGYPRASGAELSHWDGNAWSAAPLSQRRGVGFAGALWAPSSGEVWSADGDVLRFDGREWTLIGSDVSTEGSNAIWGSATDDVWVAGDRLAHWDGGAWSAVSLPGHVDSVKKLWGSGPADIWAITGWSRQPLLHYDGKSWTVAQGDTGWLDGLLDDTSVIYEDMSGFDNVVWLTTDRGITRLEN